MYSVVTPNRNRLDSLREVLPGWQQAPLVSEIVIVDFGSDRPIELADFRDRRKLKLVRVSNTDEWRIGLAINLGVDQAGAEHIVKLDSDIELRDPAWLSRLDLANAFYRGDYRSPVSNGQCAFSRAHFDRAGGYHEWLSGYGFDDSDFYIRLRRAGLEQRPIDAGVLVEKVHSLASRVAPAIATEFFRLNPPDPEARLLFTASRNTYLAYTCAWAPDMRRPYTSRPLADGVVGVELQPIGERQRRATAFANALGLIRMTGKKEHVDLLGAMVTSFLAEDGGL